jgi:hypothetical protein
MMAKPRPRYTRPALTILLVALAANVFALDVLYIFRRIPSIPEVLGMTDRQLTTQTSPCPQSCLDRINRLTVTSTNAKEFFIPFGSGAVSWDDWTDVSGVEAYVDTSLYGTIKTVNFEATVSVPTGNQLVSVRLFNSTDKHPVWNSDVTMSGSGPVNLTSKPIILDPGNKKYVVQMRNQLRFTANLLQARLRITTF